MKFDNREIHMKVGGFSGSGGKRMQMMIVPKKKKQLGDWSWDTGEKRRQHFDNLRLRSV